MQTSEHDQQWQRTTDGLHRSLTFKDFKQAFAFMAKVAEAAESAQHHPRWTNEYNKVEIWLNTHSQGGAITAKDEALAAEIDQLAKEFEQ